MLDTITRYLTGIDNASNRYRLRQVFAPIGNRYSSQGLSSAGLAIIGAGNVGAKTGAAAFYAVAGGVLVSVPAATNLPALTGINAAAGAFTAVCFFVDGGGVLTVAAGNSGASLALAGWPQFPIAKALVGILVITSAGAFTGGTTPLDTATTVYLNPVGAFDPTVLV